MSETVQIALITFLSGFGGAILGLIGGIAAAKINANAQTKQTVVQEYFKRRADAFTRVFRADIAAIAYPKDIQSVQELRAAIEEALVVASPDTTVRLLLFRDALLSHDDKRITSAKTDLAIAMQRDLTIFTEPKLEKNRWGKVSVFAKFFRKTPSFFQRRLRSKDFDLEGNQKHKESPKSEIRKSKR